ncbi:DUF2063 domain-containing protein [Pseudomonas sp. C2B4]|uniref:HvfC/BufC N-terminal domain-containing protein n=1 Tax=Pseudomonas sp. C2B4 TaxID=2735270 RepID=UPI0015863F4C|nr:DNA-binding domain-containing protein [Pseudomonas sp. C2B4]NUU36803.1 DUF2063 domain-containing protein [Pseudomonas sp. C2B4]
MSTLAAFAAALIDTQRACPEGFFSTNGADPASRFAVYRNNVQSSLINALADGYPVVRQLVGDAFFRAMAQAYIRSRPPRSPLINNYGGDFADFIEGFEPASCVGYLADVARLERLRVRAYHAADAQPLSHEQIAATLSDPSTLDGLNVVLHPSVNVLRSAFAVVAIWSAHQGTNTLEGLDPSQGQHALVLRNDLHVEVFSIDAGASAFIHGLQSGQALSQAIAGAPAFELEHTLALLISHQAITSIHPTKESA